MKGRWSLFRKTELGLYNWPDDENERSCRRKFKISQRKSSYEHLVTLNGHGTCLDFLDRGALRFGYTICHMMIMRQAVDKNSKKPKNPRKSSYEHLATLNGPVACLFCESGASRFLEARARSINVREIFPNLALAKRWRVRWKTEKVVKTVTHGDLPP